MSPSLPSAEPTTVSGGGAVVGPRGAEAPWLGLLAALGDGVWDWDLVADRVHYSAGFMALLGYDNHQTFEAKFTFRSHLHDDDRQRVTRLVRQVLEGVEPRFDAVYRMRHATGGYRWFHGRGLLLRDAQGQPIRFAGYLIDVHHRLDAEAQHQRAQEQQLQQAGREAFERLASRLAPRLGALTEGARRALKGLLHELPAPWCEHPALADAARLVDGGVTLAAQLSVLAANQPQHLEVVDLRTALPGWLAPLRAAAPAGVRWQVQLPDAALRVLADVGPLRLAVQALCANACQALAERGGQIAVGLTRTDDRGVSLFVRDEGVGMSADVQPRAFEPFFSTQPPARAAGLGLAVVHAVADALQGRVALTSQVGEGTTVTLWLPRVDEAAAVSADASVAAGSPGVRARTASPGPRGPRHVVYVDDYEAMGYLMSRMLGRLGHRVTAFERASDALAYLEAHADEVDLLVSDYNMPVFSGMDVVRRARALRPDLPVLLTSGHSTPSMVREAEAEGVLQVFNRHDSVQAQVEAIDAVLATLPPRGEAAA